MAPALRLALFVLAIVAGPSAVSAQDAAAPVVVVAVAAGPLAQVVTVTGSLVAREEAYVPARIAGQEVTAILVEAGDTVARGDPLARLEDTTLAAQVEQAKANLAAATAGIAPAEAQVRSATATARQATLALDRTRTLAERGDSAQAALDQAQAAADQTDAATGAARAQSSSAEAARAQAQAALDIARANLGWATVTAPVGGIVLDRTARLGTLTGAGEPLFRIAEDGEIEHRADVVEEDLAAMAEGDPATVSVDGSPAITGLVRLISPVIDPLTRLGEVRFALDPVRAGAGPRVGAFARAVVVVDRREALTVPIAAVLSLDGVYSVQLVRDGRVVTRGVLTGIVSDGRREILSGLSAGDVIVARAGAFLRDGDRVTAVTGSAGPAAIAQAGEVTR